MAESVPEGAASQSSGLDAKQSRVSNIASHISQEHYQVFLEAISRVSSSELAMSTFAMIVDGLPTWRVAHERRVPRSVSRDHDDHPLQTHTELCDGVAERTEAIISSFDIAALPFDIKLIHAYATAAAGSRAFHMRLIELIANAVHQLGVYLFQNTESLHKGEGLECWKPPPKWRLARRNEPDAQWVLDEWPYKPFPTLFCVSHYHRYKLYPDGLADVVGYWAEDRILGGITLFDRGTSGFECNDIWWHSGRNRATNRICRLMDRQVEDMIAYLVSETVPETSPFPVMATTANRDRIDVWDKDAHQRIFREPWERVVARKPRREPCVINERDYPEIRDELEADIARCPEVYTVKYEDIRADYERVIAGEPWQGYDSDADNRT
ncbi:hypothetical protein CONLIGDRAFT_21713 [Coniochaeta ligniaria NRRL 30616]|uniref:Uncharacterized protein n=1 Tax=Coniochaeta ligniaria NRRL 30616 TaxID=1408157 RepID=A0A1J7K3M4_9PEZI|nr:hypothetical protein CONLIGDRAFT_21713 [Coniochaeta ligniaria NRRL 30616]